MDTRFWGPDGWVFLHSIIYFQDFDGGNVAINHKNLNDMYKYYELVSKILPCKYCRKSMQKYMDTLDITKCKSGYDVKVWMYKIHNKVNNKLRRQGYCIYKNPKYDEIDEFYKNFKDELKHNKKKCTKLLICNNFIGSIIFNYYNYLFNCNNDIQVDELNTIYVDFFNYLLKYSNYISTDCHKKLKEYCKINNLKELLVKDKSQKVTVKEKLNLYRWYFNLCNRFICDNKSKSDIKKFSSQFRKYVVKTCTDPKIKKSNTCRKILKTKKVLKSIY